jgi:hypothetical protein
MAIFKKNHSRAAPIVEAPWATAGITYVDGKRHYTASLCPPGGPPYKYYSLVLSEAEMLDLALAWLQKFKEGISK